MSERNLRKTRVGVVSSDKIKALSADQRAAKLAELKEELFNLHFQQAINQLDNPMRIKAVRKDIARIKTVEREIELASSNS